MAKASEPVLVPSVLLKQSGGSNLTLREAQAVARAAGALRDRFYNDLFKAMQDPSSLKPCEAESIAVLTALLFEYDFLSPKEVEDIREGFRMLE